MMQVREFLGRAKALRATMADVGHQSVLRRESPDDVLTRIDAFVRNERDYPTPIVSPSLAQGIADRLLPCGAGWAMASEYCKIRLRNPHVSPWLFVSCLIAIFEPTGVGISIGTDVTVLLCPNLVFDDKDGMMLTTSPGITFSREGILTEKFWIPWDRSMPGVGQVDGFVEFVWKAWLKRGGSLRLAIERDLVFDRSLHREMISKAYIWGPQDLDEAILNSPTFPEDPSGTVTVHQRVDGDGDDWMFPLDRTEIMWSRRNDEKSVQIEELVLESNRTARSRLHILNRYVHSRWDPVLSKFVHFDGAVKTYEKNAYSDRLASSIKKYDGKPAYRKLFRLDVPLESSAWADLTSRFFDLNELVPEYLDALVSRA